MPKAESDAVRRADFTFQSLGVGTDITAMAARGSGPRAPSWGWSPS